MQYCKYFVNSLLINKTQIIFDYLVHRRKVYFKTFDEARLTDHHYCLTLVKTVDNNFSQYIGVYLSKNIVVQVTQTIQRKDMSV